MAWKMIECSEVYRNILALYLRSSKGVCCWLVSWGGVGQGGPLLELGAASLLSLGEKLILSETRNAEVLEEMGAWTPFRCLNSWFSFVLLHFVKQKCKKYIHNDVFA